MIQNLNRIHDTIGSNNRTIEGGKASNTISQVKLFLIQSMLDNPMDPQFETFRLRILANSSDDFGDQWERWADVYNLR